MKILPFRFYPSWNHRDPTTIIVSQPLSSCPNQHHPYPTTIIISYHHHPYPTTIIRSNHHHPCPIIIIDIQPQSSISNHNHRLSSCSQPVSVAVLGTGVLPQDPRSWVVEISWGDLQGLIARQRGESGAALPGLLAKRVI